MRSGKIKTAVPPIRARLIGLGAQIGEWGVFNLPIMAIRAVPRDGVGAESARALCVSPKVLDSPGGKVFSPLPTSTRRPFSVGVHEDEPAGGKVLAL